MIDTIDDLVVHYTANMLRNILQHCELTPFRRKQIVAAIYCLEETENDD